MIFKISISTEWLTAILLKIMNWNFPGFAIFLFYLSHFQTIFQSFTLSAPPPILSAGGDNLQPQILKRGGSEKNECHGGFKESLPQILAWGRGNYYVSCQKRLCEMKYGSEG